MALPIVGPTYQYPSEQFADCYRMRYRQALPYDRPLPYRFYRFHGVTSGYSWNTNGVVTVISAYKTANFSVESQPNYSQRSNAAYNLAYERLKGQLSGQAGWAENIAQLDKSRRMVVDRAVQLSKFVLLLKKRKFKAAARTLKSPIPGKASPRKSVAQNFLEWEYGWRPLLSDIEESLRIITKADFGQIQLKGSAKESDTFVTKQVTSTSSYFYSSATSTTWNLDIKLRAIATITNPNAFLANQLGLLDSALPWKTLPFSLVVDWFVNVEQVLSSVSDFLGVRLDHPHYTVFLRGTQENETWAQNTYTNGKTEGSRTRFSKGHVEVRRTLGIPSPALTVKPFRGFSMNRGAQAISLIVTTFSK